MGSLGRMAVVAAVDNLEISEKFSRICLLRPFCALWTPILILVKMFNVFNYFREALIAAKVTVEVHLYAMEKLLVLSVLDMVVPELDSLGCTQK